MGDPGRVMGEEIKRNVRPKEEGLSGQERSQQMEGNGDAREGTQGGRLSIST